MATDEPIGAGDQHRNVLQHSYAPSSTRGHRCYASRRLRSRGAAPTEEPDLRTIAFVPARGGSRGLPGKNLLQVAGVSLLGRAIRVAREAGIDEVVVSSDDDAILEEGQRHGARPERRAAELAGDTTSTLEVVRDHLSRDPGIDVLVLLQPTSPLRTATDVSAVLDALATAPAAVTVSLCEHPPAWTFELDESGGLVPSAGWDAIPTRRQDTPAHYRLNGAVYAARTEVLADGGFVGPGTRAVVMPPERSIDVDTALDLEVARLVATEVAT